MVSVRGTITSRTVFQVGARLLRSFRAVLQRFLHDLLLHEALLNVHRKLR